MPEFFITLECDHNICMKCAIENMEKVDEDDYNIRCKACNTDTRFSEEDAN
jgi:hypothetical protein